MGFVRRTVGGGGAEKAGELGAAASREATEVQKEMFDETKAMLEPYAQGGLGAYQQQQDIAGNLQAINPITSSAFNTLGNQARQDITSPAFQKYQDVAGTAINSEAFNRYQGVAGTAIDSEAFNRYQDVAGTAINSNAYNTMQALNGANGAGAQAAAYRNYRESPGVAFAREMGLSAVNGQMAGAGKLGAGARLRELTRVSQGYAEQGFDNYYSRLSNQSQSDISLEQNRRQGLGSLANSQIQLEQNRRAGLGSLANSQIQLEQGRRQGLGALANTEIGLNDTQYARLGGIAETELNLANSQRDLEINEYANRFNRLGAVTQTGLGATGSLAGASIQSASGQANSIEAAGASLAAGSMGRMNAGLGVINSGIQAAGAAAGSDRRLKTNIKHVGEENGHKVYTWTWNKLANDLGYFGESRGVMADEVKAKNPEAVTNINGFDHVYYEMIGVKQGEQ
jgi:hypothetical protein